MLSTSVICDMDGVVSLTAALHAAAGKTVFNQVLHACATAHDTPFRPFDALFTNALRRYGAQVCDLTLVLIRALRAVSRAPATRGTDVLIVPWPRESTALPRKPGSRDMWRWPELRLPGLAIYPSRAAAKAYG
jgi:hypothetical protein